MYTVGLPEGEYRTAIFAETLQAKTNSQGYKVGLNLSIGSALYVAKGEISPEINVIETYLNQEGKQLQILVANDGTATAKGEITWTLKQGGSEIASGISGRAVAKSNNYSTELDWETSGAFKGGVLYQALLVQYQKVNVSPPIRCPADFHLRSSTRRVSESRTRTKRGD